MPAASAPTGTKAPVLGISHPLFTTYRPVWQQLLDVFEGGGGFLSAEKPYLVAHPREYLDHSIPKYADDGVTIVGYEANPNPLTPSPKLKERRKLARYENYAETLIEQLSAALFRKGADYTFAEDAPKPTLGQRPIEAFWEDCDGTGTSWSDFLRQAWKAAGVFGHIVLYFDDAPEETDRAVPLVRAYTPLDVPDWLTNERGQLTQIKLLEAAPRDSFLTPLQVSVRNIRVRVITEEGWSLQTPSGKAITAGVHSFGQLPIVYLYAKRRTITPHIGKSVLGDPMKFIDLYNLVSEERELLRKQTFSILNVPVGPEGNIDREQGLIGRQSGTGNILFTTQEAKYISADGQNVTVYHASIDRLVRSIFRSALLPWDTDSKDAEAEGSRRIKREDLNTQLATFADECQKVDQLATNLVYQAFYGVNAWERWLDRDGLVIRWPDTFDVTPLEEIVKQITDAIHLELGETATRELKKRAVRAVMPDLTDERLEAMDQEIDAMPVVTEDERREEMLKAGVKRLAGAA